MIKNFVGLLFASSIILSLDCQSQTKLKALIIDGQNNHRIWPKSTMMMKSYLEETRLFSVDIYRTAYTWGGNEEATRKLLEEWPLENGQETTHLSEPKMDPGFKPDFAKYNVVVSNFGWRAAEWPSETKSAFEDYMKNGGGLVVVHAANNSWGDWDEFNKMIGLGGWGNRNEKTGPFVYFNNYGEVVRDLQPGRAGSHGPQHEFVITARIPDHPVMEGLPEKWMHSKDELYAKLRGPAESMNILATTFSSPDWKGTSRHEPMLMTLNYGEGRVFHSMLGHMDYSFESVGFIVTFQRGAEWAATGSVSLTEIPEDFPTEEKSSSRKFSK